MIPCLARNVLSFVPQGASSYGLRDRMMVKKMVFGDDSLTGLKLTTTHFGECLATNCKV
jgi:hypothetical protein